MARVTLDEIVMSRRMTRRFDADRPVPPALVDAMLRHARRAPSAGFSQGWDFVVLREAADRERFWAATREGGEPDAWLRGVSAAPVLIVACSDPGRYLDRYAEPDKGWSDRDPGRWPVPYWDVDTGMACLLMLLTAQQAGLGSLLFGVPVERLDAVRAALAIPADRNVVGVVAVGYPEPGAPRRSGSTRRRAARPLEQVAHEGRIGRPYAAAGPDQP